MGMWVKPFDQVSEEGRQLLLNAFDPETLVEWSPQGVTADGSNAVPGGPGASCLPDIQDIKVSLEDLKELMSEMRQTASLDKTDVLQAVSDMRQETCDTSDKVQAAISDTQKVISESISVCKTKIEDCENTIVDTLAVTNRSIEAVKSETISSRESVIQAVNELDFNLFTSSVQNLANDVRSEISAVKAQYLPTFSEVRDDLRRVNSMVVGSIEQWLKQAYEIATTETPFLVAMSRFMDSGVLDSLQNLKKCLDEATPTVNTIQNAVMAINSVVPVMDSISNRAQVLFDAANSDLSEMQKCRTELLSLRDELSILSKVTAVTGSIDSLCHVASTAKLFEKKGGL